MKNTAITKALKGKTVAVAVTGGIAAYKVLDIVKKLKAYGATVHVMMSNHATQFVDPQEFAKASGNKVRASLFDSQFNYRLHLKSNKPIRHISLADQADLILVCPATANSIGKVAHGICDDVISTSISATAAHVLFCPAMNVKMWNNPLVQENVKKLQQHGYHFVDPAYGELACGYKGVGRLAEGHDIIEHTSLLLKKTDDYKGKKVVITAGATSEPIDAVRVITNKSSGKMGVAIAEQAYQRGAEVILIRGINSVTPRYPLREIIVENVQQLHDAVKKEVKKADMLIHAAAVSDFSIPTKKTKIKSGQTLNLELQPTTKILENVKKWNKKVTLVGFKAEYSLSQKELVKRASDLLTSAQADYLVANDIGKKNRGFDVDTNEVFVVDKEGNVNAIPLASKQRVADSLLDILAL